TIETRFGELAGGEHAGVIVDMGDVPYMSSIGIRALLINAKAVSRRGGKYVVFNPQPDVKSVLEISGIDKIMDVCMDYSLALGKVSQ
ncbi:MAG: STAS domain-containing protein, partial [Oceanospirillales bacterium]|nr:STAS domain-containing protein [Oceanospirillales bacterium]